VKLRAWLIKEKIMVDVLEWYSNGRIGVSIHDSGPFLKQPEEIILMQFSGLKDRRGWDIFEGDIVKSVRHDDSVEQIAAVAMDTPTDWSWGSFGNIHHALNWMGNTCEVVGNIHENPELLK
jgi:uncharacterized phage protein (TIGR01671 family)